MPATRKYASVDDYIGTFPVEVAQRLQAIRDVIAAEIPDIEERISYHMPAFGRDGTTLVLLAAWKNHISLYPVTDAMESSIAGMTGYKTSGKGTIQFPMSRPLPLDLVGEIVRFRLREAQV